MPKKYAIITNRHILVFYIRFLGQPIFDVRKLTDADGVLTLSPIMNEVFNVNQWSKTNGDNWPIALQIRLICLLLALSAVLDKLITLYFQNIPLNGMSGLSGCLYSLDEDTPLLHWLVTTDNSPITWREIDQMSCVSLI